MKGLRILCLVLLTGMVSAHVTLHAGGRGDDTSAEQAFEKMKTLVGTWEATTEEGKKAILTYELVSGHTTLLERFVDEGSHQFTDLITMYHMDGDHLMLTHYCGANNQPRMHAESISPGLKSLTFSFFDATNLSSPDQAHMYKVTYKFHDKVHFTTEWTLREDQKEKFVEVLRFERRE